MKEKIAEVEADRQQYGNLCYQEPTMTPKPIKPKTLKQYEGMWRTSFEVCIEAGFYEEGIIFVPSALADVTPTVSLLLPKLIVHYHCNAKNEILCYPGTDRPVKSYHIRSIGQNIRCVGT
jgi:hypothetical protein